LIEESILQKMETMFGDRIPDFEQFPKTFLYMAKLAKYELSLEKKEQSK